MICLHSFNLVGRKFYQEMDFQLVESNLLILISYPSIKYLNSNFVFHLLSFIFLVRMYSSCGVWKYFFSYTGCWGHNANEFPALPTHFETCPQPTPLARYFYQLPNWFHAFSIKSVIFIQGFYLFFVLIQIYFIF